MRLIDADALIEAIWKKHKETEEMFDLCVDELKAVYCGVVATIDEQPTAYNVDKVIHKIHCHFIDRIDDAEQEEIEKLKHDNKVICGIIRNGGKE